MGQRASAASRGAGGPGSLAEQFWESSNRERMVAMYVVERMVDEGSIVNWVSTCIHVSVGHVRIVTLKVNSWEPP